MANKICNKCGETKIKKDGFKRGKQRYKCRSCGYVFQNSSRSRENIMLWKDFGEGKQTYQQLSCKYNLSIRSIQTHLDKFSVKKRHSPARNSAVYGYHLFLKKVWDNGI